MATSYEIIEGIRQRLAVLPPGEEYDCLLAAWQVLNGSEFRESEAPPPPCDERAYSVVAWIGGFAEEDKRWVGALGPFEREHAENVAALLRGRPVELGDEEIGKPTLYADICQARFRVEEDEDEGDGADQEIEIDPKLIDEGRKLAARDRELVKERDRLLREFHDLPPEDKQRPEVLEVVQDLQERERER